MNNEELANSPEGRAVPDTNNRELKSGDGWKMPKAKFQQTSGYLPKGYAAAVGKEFARRDDKTEESNITPQPAEVQPQPELTEQLVSPETPEPVEAGPQPTAKSGIRWGYVVLGVGIMLAMLLAFVIVVYFLFIAPAASAGPF